MEIFFGQNLRILRERKKRSQEMMATLIGIKRSILNNYENNSCKPSIDSLLLVSEYFGISINTLLTVNFSKLSGAQLSDLERGKDIHVKGSQLRVLATIVNENNDNNVEMVSVKAKAGYASGYADPDFIGKLPSYHFPLLSKNRKYRMFQISGDSMLPIRDRSWITCEYLEDWSDIKNGQCYVVVTKDEGIVFKRVYNKIAENETLLLVSINPVYAPYEIKLNDVAEIWKFTLKFSESVTDD